MTTPGNKGLINNGNTCYLNSVVQCLTHILFFHPLNKKLIKDFEITNDSENIMINWMKVNKMMWDTHSKHININFFIKSFIDNIKKKNLYFENFQQNDAEEFITLLFDMIHKTLITNYEKKNNTQQEISWYNTYKNDYSLIIEYFYSQSSLITQCSNCNYNTIKYDPFMIFQLPINDKVNSIEGALTLDCKNEKLLDWKCDNCNEISHCSNSKKYQHISDFLIIQLKRYDKHNKNNKFIKYVEYMDMNKFINDNQGKNSLYKLMGFLVHSGGINSGHYYSICYNMIDNKWRKYDDVNVSDIDNVDVFKLYPYCLFYKRVV